ncbi:MAG: nitroreductase family protein [Candidatus Micrarchaeia archaeon]
MRVTEAINGRRSIRAFNADALPEGALDELKEAVRWAPSAMNAESRRFYFVTNKGKIEELCAVTRRGFKPEMPLIVIGCTHADGLARFGEKAERFSLMDVSASVENLLLAAHALGLGSVWCGAFDAEGVRKALAIPKEFEPVVLVPVGVPAEKPEGKRKPASETVVEVG